MGKALPIFIAVVLLGALLLGTLDAIRPNQSNKSLCETEIKYHLTSPGSMKIISVSKEQSRQGEHAYRYSIDSQNGFGALLRSAWYCTVRDGEVISLRGY